MGFNDVSMGYIQFYYCMYVYIHLYSKLYQSERWLFHKHLENHRTQIAKSGDDDPQWQFVLWLMIGVFVSQDGS
jgi:hypothetical protein